MSTVLPNSPLTEKHLQDIKTSLAQLDYADQQIALAKQAGLDVGAAEAQSKDLRQKLLGVKNVYFPNR